MDYYSRQISKLIDELASSPGIGTKSAQRLAFHMINMPKEKVASLSETSWRPRSMSATARNVIL